MNGPIEWIRNILKKSSIQSDHGAPVIKQLTDTKETDYQHKVRQQISDYLATQFSNHTYRKKEIDRDVKRRTRTPRKVLQYFVPRDVAARSLPWISADADANVVESTSLPCDSIAAHSAATAATVYPAATAVTVYPAATVYAASHSTAERAAAATVYQAAYSAVTAATAAATAACGVTAAATAACGVTAAIAHFEDIRPQNFSSDPFSVATTTTSSSSSSSSTRSNSKSQLAALASTSSAPLPMFEASHFCAVLHAHVYGSASTCHSCMPHVIDDRHVAASLGAAFDDLAHLAPPGANPYRARRSHILKHPSTFTQTHSANVPSGASLYYTSSPSTFQDGVLGVSHSFPSVVSHTPLPPPPPLPETFSSPTMTSSSASASSASHSSYAAASDAASVSSTSSFVFGSSATSESDLSSLVVSTPAMGLFTSPYVGLTTPLSSSCRSIHTVSRPWILSFDLPTMSTPRPVSCDLPPPSHAPPQSQPHSASDTQT
jgi:hypothetical protein